MPARLTLLPSWNDKPGDPPTVRFEWLTEQQLMQPYSVYTLTPNGGIEQALAFGVNENTVRKILTNPSIKPDRCMVYATGEKYQRIEDGLDGVQWLQDNPTPVVPLNISVLRGLGYDILKLQRLDRLRVALTGFGVKNISSLRPDQYDAAYLVLTEIVTKP